MSAATVVEQANSANLSTVFWSQIETPFGPLHLYSTARGLLRIALPNEAPESAERAVRAQLGPGVVIRRDDDAQAQAHAQLAAYFAGARTTFDLPLDPRGTAFQRLVWDAVAAIPHGQTRSYQQIARAIGRDRAVRAVGAANGANPLPIVIPCHRVIGADGSLTGYGGGLAMKRRLLALERA